jgi:hypothetical protein
MDLILSAALLFGELQPTHMSQIMSCPAAQEVIGRLYADEGISPEEKEELMQVILEHAPINCQIPQAV